MRRREKKAEMTLSAPLCRVVLLEPLIPENTGNISRTCVGTNAELHLIEPMGFEITESRVKRAGLDYWPHLALTIHPGLAAFHSHRVDAGAKTPGRLYFIETWGGQSLYDVQFQHGDWLVFGKETTGLSREQVRVLEPGLSDEELEGRVLRLPMPGPVRSLNLSNAVAATVFELYRQVMHRDLKA